MEGFPVPEPPVVSNATSRRATAILAMLLLLLPGVGEALGRTCEHHDGGAARARSEAPAEHAHGASGHGHAAESSAHAGRHEHPADVDDRAGEPEHEHGSESCTCAGTCFMGSGTAAPATPTTSMQLAATADRSIAIPTAPGRSPRLLPFVLPYAQAPPAGC
jgi:hypothetical protein